MANARRNGVDAAAAAAAGGGGDTSNNMVKHDEWEKAVTKQEFDRARYRHDVFNLVAMVCMYVCMYAHLVVKMISDG